MFAIKDVAIVIVVLAMYISKQITQVSMTLKGNECVGISTTVIVNTT